MCHMCRYRPSVLDYQRFGCLQLAHTSRIQMIDVGRKIVAHQVRGFLAAQVVYYLVNFNLCPRQIWITRHGESLDNVSGRIGGDSELSENGQRYARALKRFIDKERAAWTVRQRDRAASARLPPRPGDGTPPYTTGAAETAVEDKNFCVWTSMLRRSIQTALEFDEDEDFDVKQMKMLDELNAGNMDGMTYEEIREKYPDEYERRRADKLHYRYPGPGGEGYLDVIHRLRAVIVEVERMTDHVLLVCHRSVARVLLAYFLGLRRDAVADVDVPLGVLYMIQPVGALSSPLPSLSSLGLWLTKSSILAETVRCCVQSLPLQSGRRLVPSGASLRPPSGHFAWGVTGAVSDGTMMDSFPEHSQMTSFLSNFLLEFYDHAEDCASFRPYRHASTFPFTPICCS